MKRILTYLLLAAALPLQAQTLDERPAQNPEGKLFANSDLYYTSQYSITGAYPQWLEGDSFAYYANSASTPACFPPRTERNSPSTARTRPA